MKRLLLFTQVLWLCLTLNVTFATNATMRNGSGEEIMLQGFHWNSSRNAVAWYSVLAQHASTISGDGFTLIWLPPVWTDTSSWSEPTGKSGGGEGYFWSGFDKNSRYGSDQQLKQAAAALNTAGVKVVYDVVPNHMNDDRVNQSMFPRGRNEWRHDCLQCDEGDAFMDGAADLNTADPKVFDAFKNEFINLRDNYGAQGLRFDFVRGYAPETIDRWMNAFGSQQFCVGENWKGPDEYPQGDWRRSASWQDVLKDWSDRSHCAVFDFALKERMQNGSIAQWRHGLNGNPDPAWRAIAVTFVDNHDTGYSPGANGGQHHWALPDPLVNLAYAYILSSPGTPTVYWPHMYDWQRDQLIRQLIKLRKHAAIRADSPIRFNTQYSGLVGTTSGARGTLVIALKSDLQRLPEGMGLPTLTWDNGDIRIWSTPVQSAAVNISFHCDNANPQSGEGVYAVGSSLELGAWDPLHGIALTSAGNRWSTNIEVPGQQALEWKCVVRGQNGSPVYWQPGPNNSFTSGDVSDTAGRF
jgi:alpha-amylase